MIQVDQIIQVAITDEFIEKVREIIAICIMSTIWVLWIICGKELLDLSQISKAGS